MEAKSHTPMTSRVIILGLCRFCGNRKNGRIVNIPYEFLGHEEIYSKMLMDCFGLLLSKLDGATEDRLVCATCVVRLRACVAFKNQVMRAEQQFLQRLKQVKVADIQTHSAMKTHSDSEDLEAEGLDEILVDENIIDVKVEKKHVTEATLKRENEMQSLGNKMVRRKKSIKNKRAKLVVPVEVARKEELAIDNILKIVESSYVCPFNNITGNYYCFYCRSIFIVPQDLRDHTLTHNPKTFAQNLSSRKAIKIDLTRIDCRMCEDSIDNLDDLKKHLTSKHGIKLHEVDNEFLRFRLTHPTLSCLECGDDFYFVEKLIEHMAGHFGSFICEVCGATFIQASSLESHVRCHQPKRRFECKFCGKTRSTNRAIYVHIQTVHEKKPVIDCLKCIGKFFTYDARNKHMVAEHGYNMAFPCVCGRVFDTRKKFLTHNRIAHLKQYTHRCEFCEKKFFSSTHLKRHMKTHN